MNGSRGAAEETAGPAEHTTVVIVGGGIVGLSAAVFLSAHGVPAVLAERHTAPSIHPRARGFNPRSVELLRGAGMADELDDAINAFADQVARGRVESLTGAEMLRFDLPTTTQLGSITPARWCNCSQDRLEPMLRARAVALGADVRFGVEMTEFRQDSDGVVVTLRDVADGDGSRVAARYLIAADGSQSGVRQALGIAQHGPGVLLDQMSIVFRADLRVALSGRRFAICQVQNPVVRGMLVHDDTLQQGTLIVPFFPDRGESREDFTTERCIQMIQAAIGPPDIPVSVLATVAWQMSATVAERYADGRVLLAGDAVHTVPPIGGFGASTGIQDVHNLAWKIAWVERGIAGPELLATYESERLPVGQLTMEQCHRRLATGVGFTAPGQVTGLVDELALTFGYRYGPKPAASGMPAGSAAADPAQGSGLVVDPHELGGQVGLRAPHIVLERDGTQTSSLDLFGTELVLLTGRSGAAWVAAADAVRGRYGVPLAAHIIGDATLADAADGWATQYRAAPDGAVLVRPDGFVAWRAEAIGSEPERRLGDAVLALLGRQAATATASAEAGRAAG